MEEQLLYAYFAGAIDADGFITVSRKVRRVGERYGHAPTYYSAKIGFTGTGSSEVQNLLKDNFGGSVFHHTPKNPNHKEWNVWQADGKKAEKALLAILPYLRGKKRQAEVALELIVMVREDWVAIKASQKPPYRIPPEMEEKRRVLWEQATRLNSPKNRRVHFLETPESEDQ